jgi:serine/threonine protein kinase
MEPDYHNGNNKSTAHINALVREILKLQAVGAHPNIPQWHSVYSEPYLKGHRVGFIMERAYYGSLMDVLKSVMTNTNEKELRRTRRQALKEKKGLHIDPNSRWIPIALCIDWLYQLLTALKHVHDKKIEHRDVKPHNILVREDLTIALSDFGGAVSEHSMNGSTQLLTIVYSCPGRKMGNLYGPISDMYGFGVTAFTLLTQEYPDQGMCDATTMHEYYVRYFISGRQIANEEDQKLLTILLETIILPTTCLVEGVNGEGYKVPNYDGVPEFARWDGCRQSSAEILPKLESLRLRCDKGMLSSHEYVETFFRKHECSS